MEFIPRGPHGPITIDTIIVHVDETLTFPLDATGARPWNNGRTSRQERRAQRRRWRRSGRR